jgi:hypothetical protein
LGMSSSQLTFIFFRGVGSYHHPVMWWILNMESKSDEEWILNDHGWYTLQ